jgi:NAD(P)-dependent dehydrogenase (short-subunit alcohol dehydrogenase family)/quercetin dioxygenase-like cupin family protein
MATPAGKMVVNARVTPSDPRWQLAVDLFQKAGYGDLPSEALAEGFEEIHCQKDQPPFPCWKANGFIQTFCDVAVAAGDARKERCRIIMFFPGHELKPHSHELDEEFVVSFGGVDVYTWTSDLNAGPPSHTRLSAGDKLQIPRGIIHGLRADRISGVVFHEVSGSKCFGRRSTEFAQKVCIPLPFADTRVVVTGANRGLGVGFVKHLLDAGARVVAACRSPEKAMELKDLQKSSGPGRLVIRTLDVSSEESIEKFAKEVSMQFNGIDYLINNAGMSVPSHPVDPILAATPSNLREVFNTNVVGTIRLTQALLPSFQQPHSMRTIVNLSSQLASIENCLGGAQGRSGGVACYRISRAASNMAMRCFAGELDSLVSESDTSQLPTPFVCMALSPGHVATDMGSAGGRAPSLTVDESVASMLAVIGRSGPGESGKFLGHDGRELPW